MMSEAYDRCKTLLLSRKKELDLLAQALVDYETLDKDEVVKVINGEKLVGRIKMPPGPMVVPKPARPDGPINEIPGGRGEENGSPPTPPAPPAPMP